MQTMEILCNQKYTTIENESVMIAEKFNNEQIFQEFNTLKSIHK